MEWIKAIDDLPPNRVNVVTIDISMELHISERVGDDWWTNDQENDDDYILYDITHWIELTEPNKQK